MSIEAEFRLEWRQTGRQRRLCPVADATAECHPMSLAPSTAENDGAAPARRAPAPATSGRERRQHHRRETRRVWVEVNGGWYRVLDLSLGGLRIEAPVDDFQEGEAFFGELHSRALGRSDQTGFEATVTRVELDNGALGAYFAPMAPDQIDTLLAILSAVEREFVEDLEAEERQVAFRQRLRRMLVVGAILAAGTAAALAYMVLT